MQSTCSGLALSKHLRYTLSSSTPLFSCWGNMCKVSGIQAACPQGPVTSQPLLLTQETRKSRTDNQPQDCDKPLEVGGSSYAPGTFLLWLSSVSTSGTQG